MQLLGIVIAIGIVWLGFFDRGQTEVSAVDWHAAVIVIGGVIGAVFLGSGPGDFFRTFLALRELSPFFRRYRSETVKMENTFEEFARLWTHGEKTQAIEQARTLDHPFINKCVELVVQRSGFDRIKTDLQAVAHREIDGLQPAADNWELMSRLGPSFGMIGTITGMVTLFRNFGTDANIGASMSLALLATLYGITFGAAIAGPIGKYLHRLLDQRLAFFERCEAAIRAMTGT